MHIRALVLLSLAIPLLRAADPIEPVTVCEVIGDLQSYEGKDIAVLGRYSFRRDGRWISEQACPSPNAPPPTLWLTEDAASAPKPPGNFELDAAVLNRKFLELVKRTALGKFRFGTPEYDRWAVVYGRVVLRKGGDTAKGSADLLFRGSGVVVFLTTEH